MWRVGLVAVAVVVVIATAVGFHVAYTADDPAPSSAWSVYSVEPTAEPALPPVAQSWLPPRPQPRAQAAEVSPAPVPAPVPVPAPRGGARQFTPAQFVALFYQVNHPNVTPITSPPPITGDEAADQRIRVIAEGRGYRLQADVAGPLSSVDGRPVQPLAADAWRALAAAAAADGIRIAVTSGYRSIDLQRDIFLGQLGNFTDEEIAAGDADDAIDAVLRTVSIPGYSKHHTGYAVDVWDVNAGLPFYQFGQTAAYRWMSADNFANAKRFGFVPSYPHGVEQQGPNPEEWEFVWVGTGPLH
jgi:LAS superfamily LD-carboxypeptidase LdcB